MEKRIRFYHKVLALAVFVLTPVALWAISDVPQRSWLKEGLSLLTIISFAVLVLQFYMSKINGGVIKHHKFSSVLKWHKVLAYVFIGILLVHPFFIVLPRYFEAGVAPGDAFVQLISSYSNPGVLMGMIAWGLMVLLGLTAVFRNSLPLSYNTWKVFHGILSALFITAAIYHIIFIGRHSSNAMIIYLMFVAGTAILMLIANLMGNTKKESHE